MKSLLKFVAIGILAVVASGPLFAQSSTEEHDTDRRSARRWSQIYLRRR